MELFLVATVRAPYLPPYLNRTFTAPANVLQPHNRCTFPVLYATKNIGRRVNIFLLGRRTMWREGYKAWKELQYVNCYRMNSDNRNSMAA